MKKLIAIVSVLVLVSGSAFAEGMNQGRSSCSIGNKSPLTAVKSSDVQDVKTEKGAEETGQTR